MAIIAFIVFSEANNFARFVLFQGDGYAALAADCKLEIRTPIKLAKKFGSSLYASCREFARTHSRACVVYVLEPIIYCEGAGARAVVRRIEASPSFLEQFGRPSEQVLTLDHSLGRVLPIGAEDDAPGHRFDHRSPTARRMSALPRRSTPRSTSSSSFTQVKALSL